MNVKSLILLSLFAVAHGAQASETPQAASDGLLTARAIVTKIKTERLEIDFRTGSPIAKDLEYALANVAAARKAASKEQSELSPLTSRFELYVQLRELEGHLRSASDQLSRVSTSPDNLISKTRTSELASQWSTELTDAVIVIWRYANDVEHELWMKLFKVDESERGGRK